MSSHYPLRHSRIFHVFIVNLLMYMTLNDFVVYSVLQYDALHILIVVIIIIIIIIILF